jgi:flagellin
LGVALSAAEQISDKLNELKGKITEGQQQNVDLAKIQQDMDNIVQSISDIGNAAQFNGVNLRNNSSANGLDVLTGLNRTSATSESIASYNVAAQDLRTSTLGVASLSVTGNTSVNFAQSNGLAFAEGDTISLTIPSKSTTAAATP